MSSRKTYFSTTVSFLVIVLLVWYAYDSQTPDTGDDLAPAGIDYRLDNASMLVKEMSQKPHYHGSDAIGEVRQYLLLQLEEMGLSPQIQKGMAIDHHGNIAEPVNILARYEGTGYGNQALLLMSHYDSDPHSSYGASDAASGVATILEGMRSYLEAIGNGEVEEPVNDIIVLITDAEELGLNGAQLFVSEHPWADDVEIALNFESRGSGGPSYMLLETNGGNRNLINAFQAADVKYPVANSLAYSIYKKLPNDTDLTVFREDADINGMNFAFIDDHYDYHTSRDTYERLDKRTLAHQAAYLMPLLSYFSSADITAGLSSLKGEDHVYVNFPFTGLVDFPFSWLPILIVFSGLLLLVLPFTGSGKRRFHAMAALKSAGMFLLCLGVVFAIIHFGWMAISGGVAFYEEQINGFPYNGHWWIASCTMLSCAVFFYGYKIIYDARYIGSQAYFPVLFLWVICLITGFSLDGTAEGAIVPAVYLPGAGYFIIPVFLGIVAAWMNIRQRRPSFTLLILLTFPAIWIFAPFIKAFPVALGMSILFVAGVLTVLLLGLLLPIIGHYRKKRFLGHLSLLLALIFGGIAFAKAEFTKDSPKPNSLVYLADHNTSKAFWLSYDRHLDQWTKAKLGDDPIDPDSLNQNIIDSKYQSLFKHAARAEYHAVNKIGISFIKDTVVQDQRVVEMKLVPQPGIKRLEVFSEATGYFDKVMVNGELMPERKPVRTLLDRRLKNRLIGYFRSDDEPVSVSLTFPKDSIPSLEIYAGNYDLLSHKKLEVGERSAAMMPKPFVLNDAIIGKQSIEIGIKSVTD